MLRTPAPLIGALAVMEKWRIYIREAITELTHARHCYSKFEKSLSFEDIQGIFLHLHHFIVHIANTDKLLRPHPNTARAQLLGEKIDLNGIDLKSFRRLRNHLEHFDERLDGWVENYDGHTFFDRNVVTGTKGFPPKAYLRALDGDTYKFQGEDYDLAGRSKAVDALIQILKKADRHDG